MSVRSGSVVCARAVSADSALSRHYGALTMWLSTLHIEREHGIMGFLNLHPSESINSYRDSMSTGF